MNSKSNQVRRNNVTQTFGRQDYRSRRGTIGIVVLVCVVVVTSIAISTMVLSTRYRRQIKNEFRLQQADLVLDGGVRMAVSKLQEQPEYEGEIIQLETGLPVLRHSTVEIRTTRDDETGKIQLQVTAQLSPNKTPIADLRVPIEKFADAQIIRRSTSISVSGKN